MSAPAVIQFGIDRAPANRAAINKENAHHSTGPVTPEGKRRSSMNALRHGLTGRVVVLPSEDLAAYQAFCQRIIDSLYVKTAIEIELAQTIAEQYWRLNRIRSIEEGIFALGFAESQSVADHPEVDAALTNAKTFRDQAQILNNLSIYEQRIHRILEKTMLHLERLRDNRYRNQKDQIETAIDMHKLAKMEDKPWDPKEDGFILSREEIEEEIEYRERERKAKRARQNGWKPSNCPGHGEKLLS